MAFDDATEAVLEDLRRHLKMQPEYLLEDRGHGWVAEGVNVFADLIGLDDQLEATVRLDRPTPVYRVPVRPRMTLLDAGEIRTPSMLMAEYLPTNLRAEARLSMDMVHQCGMEHIHMTDATSFQAAVCLIRYRRQPLSPS